MVLVLPMHVKHNLYNLQKSLYRTGKQSQKISQIPIQKNDYNVRNAFIT